MGNAQIEAGFIERCFPKHQLLFSNQNAEAALLHGADVKEMIEEPMKVRTFAFFSVEDI